MWERLRRPDWLRELQAVLVLGLVLVGGSGVIGAATAVGDPLQLELPASAVSGTVDHGLREGVSIAAEQDVTVTVADPSLLQRAAWALTALPTSVVVAAVLVLLLLIVRDARRSDPFTMTSVRRLRLLAGITLIGGYAGSVIELVSTAYLSSTVVTDGFVGFSTLPLHWFLLGAGLLALAEVVKRGQVMRAELDTVV